LRPVDSETFKRFSHGRSVVYALELVGETDDFAAREAATAAGPASDVAVVAPGVAVARAVDTPRVRRLAYTRAAVQLLGETDASVESARALLSSAPLHTTTETVAVRARDVRGTAGVSTATAERELGSVLVSRGFTVDLDSPDRELRALFAGDSCHLGWVCARSVRDFGDRQPTERPFFQPGSMAPLDARAYANLAGAGPGRTLVDPMCGTGGLLIEGALAGSRVVGVDAQRKMVRGTRQNLTDVLTEPERDCASTEADTDDARDGVNADDARDRVDADDVRDGVDADEESREAETGESTDETVGNSPSAPRRGTFDVLRGDATALPVGDDTADGVVVDAPYGRQSKIAHHDLATLVGEALAEARRVAPRCVLIADRDWSEAAERAGWSVERVFERRVHRSLVRHVHLLDDVSEGQSHTDLRL
jgi:tRNA (guanine10-N2)-dimethyltransferase